jgi:ketosteroid isomerase-like protein
MPEMTSRPYNMAMDTTEKMTSTVEFAVAGSWLEALAVSDFTRLTTVLDKDAAFSALLPRGFREWRGAANIAAVFEGWFGDVEQCELIDASVGQVGSRLQMRWQLRLRGPRLGPSACVVEQYAYADTASTGRIQSMRLLCSGFCPEPFDA